MTSAAAADGPEAARVMAESGSRKCPHFGFGPGVSASALACCEGEATSLFWCIAVDCAVPSTPSADGTSPQPLEGLVPPEHDQMTVEDLLGEGIRSERPCGLASLLPPPLASRAARQSTRELRGRKTSHPSQYAGPNPSGYASLGWRRAASASCCRAGSARPGPGGCSGERDRRRAGRRLP